MKKIIKSIKRKLFPPKDYVLHDGFVLPANNKRFNGPVFYDNHFYLETGKKEAHRVIDRLNFDKEAKILEIACGSGRFATGLIRALGPVNYLGLDVHSSSIQWCKKHIEKNYPSYRFEHLNIASERYNVEGDAISKDFRFPIGDNEIDIIYSWGLLTNLDQEVLKIYLKDFKRILAPDGKIFLTAFVEENVPDYSVNPEGYLFEKFSGPLQVVRYEKKYLMSLFLNAGLKIDEFIYGQEFDGQSEFYMSHADNG